MKHSFKKILILLSSVLTMSSCGEVKYPTLQAEVDYIESSYDLTATSRTNKILMNYSDSYFYTKSTSEDIPLEFARISLGLSLIAHPASSTIAVATPNHVKYFFQSIEYTKYKANKAFSSPENEDDIGLCFGYKQIGDYHTVAVGIRGFAYEEQWAGNFKIGTSEECIDHLGFYNAAKRAESGIRDYIKSLNLEDGAKLRLWTAGYSRGGAVSTLLGRILDDERVDGSLGLNLSREDQYSFGFETVKCSGKENNELYNNIHSFNNKNDFITYLVPEAYGFHSIGQVHYINNYCSEEHFKENLKYFAWEQEVPTFKAYTLNIDIENREFNFAEDPRETKKPTEYYEEVIDLLLTPAIEGSEGKDLSSRDNYANNIQFAITDIIQFGFGLSSIDLLKVAAQLSLLTEDDLTRYLGYLIAGEYETLKSEILGILDASSITYNQENADKIFEQIGGVFEFIVDLASSEGIDGDMINSLGTIIKNADYIAMQHYDQVVLCYYM